MRGRLKDRALVSYFVHRSVKIGVIGSVTRFGEISPLRKKLKSFGQLLL